MMGEDYGWIDAPSNGVLSNLLALIKTSSRSIKTAARAFFDVIGGRWGRTRMQVLPNGWVYFEQCPGYIKCKDGVSEWGARGAWKALQRAVGWREVSRSTAERMGVVIRKGMTHGRHCILKLDEWLKLRAACLELRDFRVIGTAQLRRPMVVGRTQAVRCPIPWCQHSNNDRHKSFVIWANDDLVSGGAKCLTSGETFPVRLKGRFIEVVSVNLNTRRYTLGVRGVSGGSDEYREERSGAVFGGVQEAVERQDAGVDDRGGRRERKRRSRGVRSRGLGDGRKAQGSPDFCVLRLLGRLRVSKYGTLTESQEARLRSIEARTKYRSSFLETAQRIYRAGSDLEGSIPEILERYERLAHGPKTSEKAADAEFYAGYMNCPEMAIRRPMLSISRMVPAEWGPRFFKGDLNDPLFLPTAWRAAWQEWLLFDLDHIDGLMEVDLEAFGRWLNQELETIGVWTGETGLQVWVKIRGQRPSAVFDDSRVKGWYGNAGETMLEKLRSMGARGGELDWSVFGAGRNGRLPGWRIQKDGSKWMAHRKWGLDVR